MGKKAGGNALLKKRAYSAQPFFIEPCAVAPIDIQIARHFSPSAVRRQSLMTATSHPAIAFSAITPNITIVPSRPHGADVTLFGGAAARRRQEEYKSIGRARSLSCEGMTRQSRAGRTTYLLTI
ncbi:MAG: hypothetical protein ACSLE1_08010 [Sphingobium sp.]